MWSAVTKLQCANKLSDIRYLTGAIGITMNRHSSCLCSSDSSILPIDLLSFDGNAEGGILYMLIGRQPQRRNDHFCSLSPKDATDWAEVGRISGAGDSQSARVLGSSIKTWKGKTANFARLTSTEPRNSHNRGRLGPDKLVTFLNRRGKRADHRLWWSDDVLGGWQLAGFYRVDYLRSDHLLRWTTWCVLSHRRTEARSPADHGCATVTPSFHGKAPARARGFFN